MKCPFCKEEILDNVTTCNHCKSLLVKECPFCRETIKYEAVKCKFCGSPLNTSNTLETAINTNPSAAASATSVNVHLLQSHTSGLAMTSFVLALLGLLTTWLIPVLTQIISIICGHISLSHIRNSNGQITGEGLAIAGLVISYIMLIIGMVIILIGVGIIAMIFS